MAMTYRCEICGEILEGRPFRPESILQPDGFWENGYTESCPYCESPYIFPHGLYGENE